MSTETQWIEDWLSASTPEYQALIEFFKKRNQPEVERSIEEVQEVFTEYGKKIHSLLESKNIEEVEQGLVLLDTPNVLQTCFVDTSTEHSFFDFFELQVDNHCLFKELYDAIRSSRYTHRLPVLEFVVLHAPSALTWAQDLDAYLRIPWTNQDTWPERKALAKTKLQTLNGNIDASFMNDVVRIKLNREGTFTLITDDFQQTVCSVNVLTQIALQFPKNQLLLNTLLNTLKDGLQSLQNRYPLSLLLRDIASSHSNREFLQELLKTLNSDTLDIYYWVRESAVSNPMFSLNELTAMKAAHDRYIFKGIVQNPNCSDELKAQINSILEDVDADEDADADADDYDYDLFSLTNIYTLSSNTGTYGETAYMGLDELVSYCLKVHQDDAEYFMMNFELSEGITIDQGQYFMDNLQQMAWDGIPTRLGSFENCVERETPRLAKEGWLLLESMVKSDCEYDDELEGTVYFELELEYPLDPTKITWHTDSRGKWGLEYDGVIHRGQSGSPDHQGGYATALKLFTNGEWKELPSIIGTSWWYDFLLKGCDVDKSSETAHADMKAWLLEHHPDLKQAIASIHTTEQSNTEQ